MCILHPTSLHSKNEQGEERHTKTGTPCDNKTLVNRPLD